jgi:hypothetical protein
MAEKCMWAVTEEEREVPVDVSSGTPASKNAINETSTLGTWLSSRSRL